MLPFLLATPKRHLDWRHEAMKCLRCSFGPFFLQTSLKVCKSTGPFCRIRDWGWVRAAGRPVQHPLLLLSCLLCRMWFCIVLLKYAWASLEEMSTWRQHIVKAAYCSNFTVYFSVLMVPRQKCKAPLQGHWQPYPMTDPGIWMYCC